MAKPDYIQDEMLPLEINHIPERIRLKYEKELDLPCEEKQIRLLELIKLLEGHKLSKNIVFKHDFLNCYLIQSRYDVQRAFSMIRSFLTLRKNHGYFFKSIKFDFTANPTCHFMTPLPFRSSDGSVIIVYEMGKWNPDEIPFEIVKQLSFLIYMNEVRNHVTQLTGFNAILDFTDMGLRHLKYCTPYILYLLTHVSFEVFPVIYKGYHLINGKSIINSFLTLMKPFMPSFIKKIIHIHSTPEKLLEYFPRSVLPTKYGGNLTEYYMADRLKNMNQQYGNYPIEGLENTF